MKDINIEINVCDSTGKSTCIAHPPIQVNPHSCCHSGNGQEPGVSGVASVFGRIGVVTAQPGDYTADQITETATRKFATPDEKAVWNAKQDELISGTTIRTVFGQSLLGSGDLSLTPAQMGVAAVGHTHTTAEITDYTQKTKQLIHSSLEAGAGVTLSYNPASEKTVISATGGGSGSDGSGYIVADRQGATAGQNHAFSISPKHKFNLAAYALKEEAGAANQTYVVDDFNASSEPNYNATNDVIFDGSVNLYRGETYSLISDNAFYSSQIRTGGESILINAVKKTAIPKMTSNSQDGYTLSASTSILPNFPPYLAFDGITQTTAPGDCWASENVLNSANPQWLRVDFPEPVNIGSYMIKNRGAKNRTIVDFTTPRTWELQASNDGNSWKTIHTVTNDINTAAAGERFFTISNSEYFSSYRLFVTLTNGNGLGVTIGEFQLYPQNKILIKSRSNEWYSSRSGVLSVVSEPHDASDFLMFGFDSSGDIQNSQLNDLMPIKVFSANEVDVDTLYTPYSQIVIQKSLTPAAWPQINAATLTATQTGNGKVRVAVTRDLVNWHVLRNGAWVDIGALSADTAGATALIADGMTPTELGAITAAQWTQLFASSNGVPDSLAFAFALDITDPAADVATIDRLVLNVNDASNWKVQSPAEVEIRWRTDSVTFRTVTAGNYKLAYQVP
ncbi:discoidin domain-containing protein [Pectobacterium aroidearum]|uniref:discoidin domain-containing protein n=1 Tax=Pectobacterium aroidearum TaxID=1201031 RepID=UPI0032EACBEE